MAHMSQFELLQVVTIDGREWWCCPYGGPRCGRVLVDTGQMGLDALSVHVEWVHVIPRLTGGKHE